MCRLSVRPLRLRVKKKKQKEEDTFEKVEDVRGLVIIWITSCHAALQEQGGRERLV